MNVAGHSTRSLSATTSRTRRTPLADGEAGGKFTRNAGSVEGRPAEPNLPNPLGDLSRASIEALVDVVGEYAREESSGNRSKMRNSIRLIGEFLSAFPGETWNERWLATGLDDESTANTISDYAQDQPGGGTLTQGVTFLIAFRAVQPSLAAIRRTMLQNFAQVFLRCQQDPLLELFCRGIAETGYSGRTRQRAYEDLASVLVSQQIPAADLTPEALLHYAWEWRRLSPNEYEGGLYGGKVLWEVLCVVGHFSAMTPNSVIRAMNGHHRDVGEVVRRQNLGNKTVEKLLVDYMHVRVADGMDFSSARSLARRLAGTFWKQIEVINPAQPDLHLSAETFQEWLRRTSVKADGTPRRDLDNLILSVKAFYLDLSAWAVAEPERWGMWAAPNPVPHTLTRGYGARARKRTELVHARVRTLQPLLAVLVEHVDADLVSARKLLTRVKEVQPGEEFTCDGRRYRRPWTRHDQQHTLWDGEAPLRCHDAETGEAVNAGLREDEAFWTWAIVHVLRLTGVRIEELMELTHLSIRQYQRPNGELIGLLVVAPSKNDRERVIPMSAELFHAIAEILRRLTANGKPVRVLRRWDGHEKIMSEPLPFLFQRSMNHASGCISATVVNKLLKKACKTLEASDHRFHDVHFTAHDFRRLFATDLVNNGVPIHIGAALLGHLNIQTTRGYVKARELHQTGAKSQVTCSRRRPDGPQRYYELAF
ncbi:site-specific integrase [Streptomyces sp. NPDC053813]|uniref:site-specific integrase n=1 Tax=Streptomyces sp. NPDC053813 TaxID=3365717 RepID=UPI0037CD6B91